MVLGFRMEEYHVHGGISMYDGMNVMCHDERNDVEELID